MSPARLARTRFVVRLLVAYGVSLAAVGLLQYQVTSRWSRAHYIEDERARLAADARLAERAYAEVVGDERSAEEIGAFVVAVTDRPGVVGARLLDAAAQGVTTRAGPPTLRLPSAAQVRAARAGAVATVRSHDPHDGWRTMTAAPVDLPTGRHVLLVAEDGERLDERLAALRREGQLLVVLGLALGTPLFYLLGGHALTTRHHVAVERSRRDGLTGLGNRRAFEATLQDASAQLRREGDLFAVALLDLDDFKLANDRRGHRYGDWVLREFAAVLRGGRSPDRAFRIGGDEFALVLPGTGLIAARAAAERVRAAVAARDWEVTVSVGVATLARPGDDVATLLERADAALYEAKRRGRDAVVAYEATHDLARHAPGGTPAVALSRGRTG